MDDSFRKNNEKEILNIFKYIEHFIGTYNNSIDRLPQMLNNKSEMKASITNIRNSIRKIISFITKGEERNLLEQIYSSSNSQFIFLLEILKIHLSSEYIMMNNSLLKMNYTKYRKEFDLKSQNKKVKLFEQKNKRAKSFVWRIMIAYQLLQQMAKELKVELNPLEHTEIIKEISFPPEYKQAGLGILNFFADQVAVRYPDDDVEVSIQQIKSKVILVIKPPKGKVKSIVQDFETFGEVVTEKIPIELYTKEQSQIELIKNKIELSKLEIKLNKQVYKTEKLRLSSQENQPFIGTTPDTANDLSLLSAIFDNNKKNITIGNLHFGDNASVAIGDRNIQKENNILINS